MHICAGLNFAEGMVEIMATKVCTYSCMRARVYMMYACLHVHWCVCVCVCLCLNAKACTRVVCFLGRHSHVYTYISTHKDMHVTCLHACCMLSGTTYSRIYIHKHT